jgi:hypothetical protein
MSISFWLNITSIYSNQLNTIVTFNSPGYSGVNIIYWNTLGGVNNQDTTNDERNWYYTHQLGTTNYVYNINGFRDYPNGFNLPSPPYQLDPEVAGYSKDFPVVRSSLASSLLGKTINFITTGGKFNFAAIDSDGKLYIWGFNAWGLCNIPSDLYGSAGSLKCVKVSIGDTHVLALMDDGSVRAWGGGNLYGECNIPVGLPPCKDIVAISGYRSLDSFDRALDTRVNRYNILVTPGRNVDPLHTCGISIFVLQDGSVRAIGKGDDIINTQFTGIRVDKVAFGGFLSSDIMRDSLGQNVGQMYDSNGNYLFEPVEFTRVGNTQEGYYWMNAEYMLSYTELL